MTDCIFCDIAQKQEKARIIYEDDICVAFLDHKPAVEGHIVLIPKKHVTVFPQLEKEQIIHLFATIKLLSNTLLKGLKLEGTSVFIANGAAAGQKAEHLLIHIIPRKEGDGLNFLYPEEEHDDKEYIQITEKLKEKWYAIYVDKSKEQ